MLPSFEIEQDLKREGLKMEQERGRTPSVREELLEYHAGERRTFDLPLVFAGSEWQKAVWRALTHVPFGETRAYGKIAAMLGRSRSARALGKANATNRLPLVVPYHRVIGVNGTLTGFACAHLKTQLLDHETAVLARAERP